MNTTTPARLRAYNRLYGVVVDMTGKCIAANANASTAVRKTTCGQYAVVAARPRRDGSLILIATFQCPNRAFNYNFSLGRK